MKKQQEVEVKYPLLNPSIVLDALRTLSAKKIISDQYQLDIYYTPRHRNFLDHEIVSEWLRIRKTGKKNTVNFKRWLPIGAAIQTHCDEFEVVVDDAQLMEKLFHALDFLEIIRVEKKRNSWRFRQLEISVDEVNGLGYFIELEAVHTVEEKDIPNIQRNFSEILQLLNAEVGVQDRRGYPYLMIEHKKG